MAGLDLVCGPAEPLVESGHSYKLMERLGSGGQAEVYKAVRQSGGVSSAPVTLKVFRPSGDRPIDAQYRSWDKGDAVLMDLGSRNVPGICRRIDAFYGAPPRQTGAPLADHQVPYQVLEYLPGQDLRELLVNRNRGPIDAVGVLRTIAGVLNAMHRPGSPDIHPSLHMDIKPANVIVLPSGEARVIDFTGSRYSAPSHMTTISYTPESAGPEAREGRVGPSYDVHGFGAVAFYLVTGVQPRSDSPQAPTADANGWANLRRHPVVESDPRLREHLLAPLSDQPRDRPPTSDLFRWIDYLAELMRASRAPGLGVDWGGVAADSTVRVPTQAHAAPASAPIPAVAPTAPIPTTRRLGVDRDRDRTKVASAPVSPPAPTSPAAPPPPSGRFGRGTATPTHRPHDEPDTQISGPTHHDEDQPPPPPPRPWFGREGKLGALSSGGELSMVGLLFFFVCWGIWALSNLRENFLGHILVLLLWIVLGIAVFAAARAIGTLLLVRWLGRTRESARLSHLASGAFLVYAGIYLLGQVTWITSTLEWISNLF
ncbi:serine/threonine protein kinase [Stackebrandtia nassauensis]|uniref:non-specific serine/threonine protein kinase n=1 Tax=Stackebrandtia nassauensis (strain DSM 44728 / CIP 108903 / NRRL B-16338 / NBRC 102104 / LLR-40K-21) TaxID=446470 RepID=D3PVV3_STANL|nr:serine/threonine protein kinase [Stackebrandtia nassauensis]ADD45074.1 serine/threonine protein kinase [Stackebrandtia nassauensis DSM 44728]